MVYMNNTNEPINTVISDFTRNLPQPVTFMSVADGVIAVDATNEVSIVLCGEIVMVDTEDGPTDGRCSLPASDVDTLACEGHSALIRSWRNQTEAETLQWEMDQEDRY